MTTDQNHAALRLGNWLKTMRQKKGIVKRIFAERTHFTPPIYTEVEAGVVSWIQEKNEAAITIVLELSSELVILFNKYLSEARSAGSLVFSQLFSRDQLTPVRWRLNPDRDISEIEVQTILDAVFAPQA